jgi:hypothetical protein
MLNREGKAATQELRKARVEHRGSSRAVLGNLRAV